MDRNRRQLLKLAGAAGALSLAGCAGMGSGARKARVVVVGGGYGGATAAKYLRLWDPAIEVVMVERESMFTSCPMSNLVIGGNRARDEMRRSYDGLGRHGVRVVNDEVAAVDSAKKTVALARGGTLAYDRLVVSPGIDFNFGEIEGYQDAQERVPHAWKAGPHPAGDRSSRGFPHELRQPDQIVGDDGEGEDGVDLGFAAHLRLGEPAGLLDPAEDFLDPLPDALADLVAGMAKRAISIAVLRILPVFETAPLTAICGVTLRARRSPTKLVTS